jgi:hypothetical protein
MAVPNSFVVMVPGGQKRQEIWLDAPNKLVHRNNKKWTVQKVIIAARTTEVLLAVKLGDGLGDLGGG